MPLRRLNRREGGSGNVERIDVCSKLYDYSVTFDVKFLDYLDKFDDEITTYVIDKNVYRLFPERFKQLDIARIFFVEALEKEKNMDTVIRIVLFWEQIGVRKNWNVICIGGGITQDLTTMASNLYLRNVKWFFVPTTLLSMCDSCIGGKCGINLESYKNQLGVFYPPKEIIIDTSFLKSLQFGDYLNGWGELLKFSLTDGAEFYEQVKTEQEYIPCDGIEEYIYKGLLVKKKIIEQDEFESDLRRVLNYGHTFGHALEAYTNYQIPHGQGVIWGIDVVNYLAVTEKLISRSLYLDVKELIKKSFLCEETIIDSPELLFEIIKTDKKATGDVINFAMPDRLGHLIVHPMRIDDNLKQHFLNYLQETHEYYCN